MCVCVCVSGRNGRRRVEKGIEELVKDTQALEKERNRERKKEIERDREREKRRKKETSASAQSLLSIYSPRPKYH